MYYQNTVRAVREMMGDVKSAESDLSKPSQNVPQAHLLWMCDQLEKMDTESFDNALKAGRWIGWILAHVERNSVWSNARSRDLVRLDRTQGFDKPHQK